MANKYLLAIDIGTSGCKITLFNTLGNVITSYLGEYPTHYDKFNGVEQDPKDWWEQVCLGIKQIMQVTNISAQDIVGIGVDGHSWACLPVDRQGKPLRRAMIWLDRRGEQQTQYLKDLIGETTLLNMSGNPPDAAYITPKILWLKEHEPDLYKNTYKFLQSNAFIVYQLTDVFSQDYSQGYGFNFFNIHQGTWDQEMADDLGISLDLIAPLYHCHQVVGQVTQEAALATGLVAGIPVVAGGLDAACSTLGASVHQPGQTQEQGGQAGGMSIQVSSPLIHPQLILSNHVIPNQWLLQGGTVGGGGVLRWFKQEMELANYEMMSSEAELINPGSDGLLFLPYMAGERSPIWNSDAQGVWFGLSYRKSRAHMIRSMMEGVAYSLLHNLETAAEVNAEVTELKSVGGAANSDVWMQIKADVTGKKIVVPLADHATSLGAAMLAGVGVGVYRDFQEAVAKTVTITKEYYPNFSNHELYRKYYKLYLDLYQQLKDSYKVLAELRNN